MSNAISTYTRQLLDRMGLARLVGKQYDGNRDIYKVLGYDVDLDFQSFFSRYTRQDIAKAIIDRPVQASWKGGFEINEIGENENSEFVKQFNTIKDDNQLEEIFRRVDRLASLGEFAVLFIGFDDVKFAKDQASPVQSARGIRYIKPIGQNNVTISAYETDSTSERFMKPKLYGINLSEGGMQSSVLIVHHSRIVHIVEDPFESEIFGTPRLEAVYNRLVDLEKLVGASAEMFWRGARPGYQAEVDPEFQLPEGYDETIKEQMDEYENGLRRLFALQGMKLNALDSQIEDPKSHVDVQVMMISAATNIPKRLLVGSEAAELASSQDSNNWKDYIESRRDEHATPHIICNFITCLQNAKVLTVDIDYTVIWTDLFSQSDKDRAEVGKLRAGALKEYTTNGLALDMIPLESFFKWFLGLEKEEIDIILQELEESRESEENSEFTKEEEAFEMQQRERESEGMKNNV